MTSIHFLRLSIGNWINKKFMEFHRDHSIPSHLQLGAKPWLNPIWKVIDRPINQLGMGGKTPP